MAVRALVGTVEMQGHQPTDEQTMIAFLSREIKSLGVSVSD